MWTDTTEFITFLANAHDNYSNQCIVCCDVHYI